ncbi:MAG: pyridoxal phosphate-dependent aminotransferase [Pseudomonadota bacterium]
MKYSTSRLASVLPSASAGVSQLAATLKSQGQSVIDLGLGEPDFETPPHIIDAAHQAALSGQTKYPPTGGTAALKTAIIDKFRRDNTLEFNANEIIVGNGAKQVIFNALMATAEPKHEVLLCAPFFDSYQNIALVQGLVPVVIGCEPQNGFRLTPEQLDAHINDNTRWLLLNSPSNPAGVVYSRDELLALAEVLLKYPQVLILSDEIYEKILFGGLAPLSLAEVCPDLGHRILTVNGVSKAYAMTGWRIGYGAGDKDLIAAMTTVQSQISSGACSIAQAAAEAALTGPQHNIDEFKQVFCQRRDFVVSQVAAIDGLTLEAPGGAFYALIQCSALFRRRTPNNNLITCDADFVNHLLTDYALAGVPGSAYGVDNYFRISTATSDESLVVAMDRLTRCVEALT